MAQRGVDAAHDKERARAESAPFAQAPLARGLIVTIGHMCAVHMKGKVLLLFLMHPRLGVGSRMCTAPPWRKGFLTQTGAIQRRTSPFSLPQRTWVCVGCVCRLPLLISSPTST